MWFKNYKLIEWNLFLTPDNCCYKFNFNEVICIYSFRVLLLYSIYFQPRYLTTTLNTNIVGIWHMLEVFPLCIADLPRKVLHLLSKNSHFINLVLYFKTGNLHSKLHFDNSNYISKMIVWILYFSWAPQIGNALQNPRPYFHLRFLTF